MRIVISLFFLGFTFVSFGQNDSIKEWSYETYISWVMKQHPLARRAQLTADYAQAERRLARGGFDPKLDFNLHSKDYKGTNYYNLVDAGLKVPVWFGDLKVGFSNYHGDYVNPERNVPEDGLIGVGIELPVGKGLFIDQRRAALKQANIYGELGELDKQILLNELWFEASTAYYQWENAFLRLRYFEELMVAVAERNKILIQQIRIGEKPAIDSLEAGIQFNIRKMNYLGAETHYWTSKNTAEAELWFNYIPLELDSNITPVPKDNVADLPIEEYIAAVDSISSYHPEIQKYIGKNSIIDIEERWMKEQFKPQLDLSYTYIQSPDLFLTQSPDLTEDYKFGATFSFPIFLRKERAKLQQVRIKQEENTLLSSEKSRAIQLKFYNLITEYEMIRQQLELNTLIVNDYTDLVDAERRLFGIGESSLFLVNQREQKLLEYQLKQVDLATKLKITKLKLDYLLFLNDVSAF